MGLTEQDFNRELQELVAANVDDNRIGAFTIKENLTRSPLWVKNRLTAETVQLPKVFTEETIDDFRRIVSTACRIFVKTIREYLLNDSYRKLFAFDPELEELILATTTVDSPQLLPMARFDIFYHEDTRDFYFCEVNADGASGMNEDRILRELNISNPAFQEFRRRHELGAFELFDSWVAAFTRLYSRYPKRVERPNVAIVDFLDLATIREFEEFARRFQRAGLDCEICDARELRYENGALLDKYGRRVDAIYRRAVTHDVMDRRDSVRPFLNAVRDGAVFMAGGFCTQVVHSKRFFYVLHTEETRRILTPEEFDFIEAHVPLTKLFRPGCVDLAEVLRNRERYILKPTDSYASKGVFAGVETSQSEWEDRARAVYGEDYVCQRFCSLYQTPNIDFSWGDGAWRGFVNMSGLFVYDGQFAGVYSRQAQGNAVIATYRTERTLPTYYVKEK